MPAFGYTVTVVSVPNFVITLIVPSLKNFIHSSTLRITISSYSVEEVLWQHFSLSTGDTFKTDK